MILHRSYFQATYQELFGPRAPLSSQPSLFPPTAFTLENFLWGVGTVRARAHAPLDGDDIALVPLADAVCVACCCVRGMYMNTCVCVRSSRRE